MYLGSRVFIMYLLCPPTPPFSPYAPAPRFRAAGGVIRPTPPRVSLEPVLELEDAQDREDRTQGQHPEDDEPVGGAEQGQGIEVHACAWLFWNVSKGFGSSKQKQEALTISQLSSHSARQQSRTHRRRP
jgi:hypothetical protein